MKREIVIDTEQLESLLALIDNYGTIGDIYTARDIYKASTERTGREDARGAHLAALGAVLRIGYIMGQRAERRRHTHTHTAPRLSSPGLAARKSERGLLRNG